MTQLRRSQIRTMLKNSRLREIRDPWVKRTMISRQAELHGLLAELGPPVYRKCHECGKSRPEEETTLVSAKTGGDYRRAMSRREVRVCFDCTVDRVGFVRGAQAKGENSPVNDRTRWEDAAYHFGIDIEGLRLNQMTDRVGVAPRRDRMFS